MQRPQLATWNLDNTHCREHNSTRLQEALLYTALHCTYMCNIVTEFYLYSIVYIYLINSRLDVTSSVHHFRTATLSDNIRTQWSDVASLSSRFPFRLVWLDH